MADLVYQNAEALRCADQQTAAISQLNDADDLCDGLDERVRKTYGRAASAMRADVNAIMQARAEAFDAIGQLTARLAQFCTDVDATYRNADQQAAENVARQLRAG